MAQIGAMFVSHVLDGDYDMDLLLKPISRTSSYHRSHSRAICRL